MPDRDNSDLQDFFRRIQYYVRILWENKFWMLLFVLISATVSGYFAYQEPVTRTAPLTFMINEDGNNLSGGVGVILGQFGLGGGAGKFNASKVFELSKSRKVIYGILLDSFELDGIDDLIANHLLSTQKYADDWENKYEGIRFSTDNFEALSLLEKSAIQRLHNSMCSASADDTVIDLQYPDGNGIFYLASTLKNELLAVEISNRIYEAIADFYILQSIGQQRKTFELIEANADSIRQVLYSKEEQLAAIKDRSQSVFSARVGVQQIRLTREVQGLSVMYAELLKNRETSRFLLQNATPVFQVIDRPYLPLAENRRSVVKAVTIGGVLGGLIIGFVSVFWRVYRDTMKDSNGKNHSN